MYVNDDHLIKEQKIMIRCNQIKMMEWKDMQIGIGTLVCVEGNRHTHNYPYCILKNASEAKKTKNLPTPTDTSTHVHIRRKKHSDDKTKPSNDCERNLIFRFIRLSINMLGMLISLHYSRFFLLVFL